MTVPIPEQPETAGAAEADVAPAAAPAAKAKSLPKRRPAGRPGALKSVPRTTAEPAPEAAGEEPAPEPRRWATEGDKLTERHLGIFTGAIPQVPVIVTDKDRAMAGEFLAWVDTVNRALGAELDAQAWQAHLVVHAGRPLSRRAIRVAAAKFTTDDYRWLREPVPELAHD